MGHQNTLSKCSYSSPLSKCRNDCRPRNYIFKKTVHKRNANCSYMLLFSSMYLFSLVYFDATKQRGPPSFVWYPPMRAQKPIDSSRVRQPVKAPLKPVSQEGRRGGSAATVLGFLHRRKRLKHLRRRATFSRGPSEPRQPTTFAPGAKRSPREEVTKESKKEPPLGIGGKKKKLVEVDRKKVWPRHNRGRRRAGGRDVSPPGC